MHGVNNQYRGKGWRQAQYLADIFWKRWIREYLHVPTLQVRKKWLKKRPKLAVGDYVLLVDENCPRGRWPKGVIQEVFPDRHRVDRHVTVKTATMSLRRDIRKLCLLERSLMSKEWMYCETLFLGVRKAYYFIMCTFRGRHVTVCFVGASLAVFSW